MPNKVTREIAAGRNLRKISKLTFKQTLGVKQQKKKAYNVAENEQGMSIESTYSDHMSNDQSP